MNRSGFGSAPIRSALLQKPSVSDAGGQHAGIGIFRHPRRWIGKIRHPHRLGIGGRRNFPASTSCAPASRLLFLQCGYLWTGTCHKTNIITFFLRWRSKCVVSSKFRGKFSQNFAYNLFRETLLRGISSTTLLQMLQNIKIKS
jgi:hypothetical protein